MSGTNIHPNPVKVSRVLIVEDQPDSRESLRMLLEMMGYEVEVACDGVEGVERALAWRPDTAIVDIGLPRLDGHQVARRLRQELGRGVRLIAHTGYGSPEDREKALQAGFDAHVVKSAALNELLASLGWR